MSTAGSATRLTYDDLVAMFPEGDRLRHELIAGEHFVTPSPTNRHQELSVRLTISIGVHLEGHSEQGKLYAAPFDVVITPYDVVEPDLLVVLGDQLHILTEANVKGAPGLVVEILSPGTRKRDQTLKRQLFDREGVREYWMVDPDRNRVVVCRRAADGSFPLVNTLDTTETLTTPLLPGWGLPLDKLFL
ncbi:MAG: Uma2 family endonuclease [Acidobacteriota bacterium]|nr:Uma2 family endonuclease [Acidobacteriota bacterium]